MQDIYLKIFRLKSIMGFARRLYGASLVLVGTTTFPIIAPTLGAISLSCGTMFGGMATMLS